MTVLDHIKQLAVGLTRTEKQELTDYLSRSEAARVPETPKSLRGDWRTAFSSDTDIDADLAEIRSEWQREWDNDDFVG
jgi:hypothetical protein